MLFQGAKDQRIIVVEPMQVAFFHFLLIQTHAIEHLVELPLFVESVSQATEKGIFLFDGDGNTLEDVYGGFQIAQKQVAPCLKETDLLKKRVLSQDGIKDLNGFDIALRPVKDFPQVKFAA